MFIMMNELRFQVGLGGVGPALAGYLYSLQYARERAQGRRSGWEKKIQERRLLCGGGSTG